MTDNGWQMFLLGFIPLLALWLIFRIKNQFRVMIREEIYNNFPSIKDAIDSLEHRIDFLVSQMEILEDRIRKLKTQAI